MGEATNHDVIAIGASAGSVPLLLDLAARLPADLPASVFIALHTQPDRSSLLPELLSSRGPLPASHPLHDEASAPGHIYVAPPDNQLILRPGSMQVVRGPRENGFRPSVDALFRSAAMAYGPRVVGVVLTGYGDCGTAGMMSIRARGGLGVAQSPESAEVPDMPRSAIDRAGVDHVVTPAELPGLLARLAASPPGAGGEPDRALDRMEGREAGPFADVVCPICHGALTEAHAGRFEHFRCHVGHSFSFDALMHEQDEELERALWAAARALEESAGLHRRMRMVEHGEFSRRHDEIARTQAQQAALIRSMLLGAA